MVSLSSSRRLFLHVHWMMPARQVLCERSTRILLWGLPLPLLQTPPSTLHFLSRHEAALCRLQNFGTINCQCGKRTCRHRLRKKTVLTSSVPFIWCYGVAAWTTKLSRVAHQISHFECEQYYNITLSNLLACYFPSVASETTPVSSSAFVLFGQYASPCHVPGIPRVNLPVEEPLQSPR